MVHSLKNKGDWYKQWPEGENASAIYSLKKGNAGNLIGSNRI
jgi:hypothetical protein